jgi:hypothetical protein
LIAAHDLLSDMPLEPINKIFIRGESRLFTTVWLAIVLTDALAVGALLVRNNLNLDQTDGKVAFDCLSFPYSILFPVIQPLKQTIENIEVHRIILDIVDMTNVEPSEGIPHTVTAFASVQNRIFEMVYLRFYEQHRPHIQVLYGTDTKACPQIFQFAWVIRNGVAHHGGHINFTNPTYPTVTWHTFTYSPTNNGKPIFNERFSVGDLLMLLFECSDALDAAGVPIPSD